MPELTLTRIPFSETADNQLRMLKARTGITPNILCRLGFCLSLEEQGLPAKLPQDFTVGREINRYTLLGRYDQLFVALLKTRLIEDGLSLAKVNQMFLAHINRGVDLLSARLKSVVDVSTLGLE